VGSSSGAYSPGSAASNLVDGQPAAWLTPGRATPDPEYAVLELGATKKLARVRLRAASSYLDLFPSDFRVEIRAPGAAVDAWTPIVTESGFAAGPDAATAGEE